MAGSHFNIVKNTSMSVWVYLGRVDRTGHQDWCSDVGLVDQRISVRPILQSLTLYGTIRKTGCDQIGMRTDPEESNSLVAQKRMLEQIVAIPATLYLPSSIVAELNEICETLGYTPKQLVIEALRGQIDFWNEFYEYATTLPVEPQDLGWPEDPV